MTIAHANEPTLRKSLRLWPGVALAVLLLLLKFVVPIVAPDEMIVSLFGSLGCAAAILLWWLFLSRAPWSERLGSLALIIVAMTATKPLLDKSIATGAMGFLFYALAPPILSLALVAWAVATSRLSDRVRRATMVMTILIAVGGWACVRTGGFTSNMKNDLSWRWAKTPEERLLAQAAQEPLVAAPVTAPAIPPAVPAAPATPTAATAVTKEAPAVTKAAPAVTKPAPATPAATETGPDWPGFRGPHRDGIIPGLRIATDWSASPPAELWRRPIGPGWSSFAVHGGLIYTQEQRGNDEVVSCYNAATGKPVWIHRDEARFYESNGGPGPRGTPTLHQGRVYALGATGILKALDALTGAVVWSRNAATDTNTKIPGWGFTSSPLVVDDEVIVGVQGKLAAFDLATGKPRWTGPAGGDGYSSPHLVKIDGVAQVLLMSGHGAISVAPADGKLLWQYPWKTDTRIAQPAMISDSDLLMAAGEALAGVGVRRVAVAHGPGGWTTEERWTSNFLKPNFSDYVIHKGNVYGFDGSIMTCIDLKDGTRKWKGGRYGAGQLVLLADQDLLLVLAEEGDLALVSATPEQFKELARVPGIEGKTWSHPALAGDELLVRNGQEMAAFRLTLARR